MRIGIDASRAFGEQPTGTERYATETIEQILALAEAEKHEWTLYTRTTSPQLLSLIKERRILSGEVKVQVINIPLPKLWTQVGLAARTWIDNLDVLWVPAHTLPVFRKPGGKTLVTIHGIEYEWLPAYENRLQRWYLPLSTKYAVATADKIIAVSEFTKKQLVERLGADKRKIEVVWEGATDKGSRSKGQGSKEILGKFRLRPKKYIIFVGTVQPRKNLVRLIEAFAQGSRSKVQDSNIKLVIAGKLGWMYEEAVGAPKKYGVEDKVIITGYISDEERQILLENALVYVQPSITEGFGLPILEAWQAGLPVVSSVGGALVEVVGEAGVTFNPLKVEDMSDKLVKVIGSQKLRAELITKGQEKLTKFRWERAAAETLRIIEGLESHKYNL